MTNRPFGAERIAASRVYGLYSRSLASPHWFPDRSAEDSEEEDAVE